MKLTPIHRPLCLIKKVINMTEDDHENYLIQRETEKEFSCRDEEFFVILLKITGFLISILIPLILWAFGLLGANYFSMGVVMLPFIILILCIVDAEQKGGR
jgi:hypothetical protein